MNESLVANKWYPQYKGPGRSYKRLYPSPQTVLRQAVGAEEYLFISNMVTTEHIRAAVIMPVDVPFQHLLADVPWGMSYTTSEWRMLIVSVLDTNRWIDLARASGAIAWLKNHSKTFVYIWEPPVRDVHGLTTQESNEPEYNSDGKKFRKDRGRPKKFNRDDLLGDLHEGKLTKTALALKHNISRFTVCRFAQRNGFSGSENGKA